MVDRPQLRLVATLSDHQDPTVWHVAWSASGLLASCGTDKAIRLWAPSAATGAWQCVAVLEEAHPRTVRCCAWSPGGEFIASCSFDGTACVWEVKDNEFDCVASLEGHENEVKAVAWSHTGQYLATCGRDKSVWVWEGEDEQYEVAAVVHSHTQDVKRVAWHPRRDVLASVSYDDTFKLFTQFGDDWRCASTLAGHASTVWGLAFNADGSAIVTCSDDRAVVLWRDATPAGAPPPPGRGGAPLYEEAARLAAPHSRAIYSVAWADAAAGELIATGSGDDAVCLLRASLGAEPALHLLSRTEAAHAADVNCVAWRPGTPGATPTLATTGDDGCVKIWHSVGAEG